MTNQYKSYNSLTISREKRLNLMKSVVIVYSAAFSLVSLLPEIVIAQEEPDTPCYVRQSDGTVVDLSAWCIKNPAPTITPGAAFVSNFRSLANTYPAKIRQELNQYSDQHTNSAIASAKTTCRVLRYGGAQAELTRRRALASAKSSASEVAKQEVIYTLAINQYCPEFSDR